MKRNRVVWSTALLAGIVSVASVPIAAAAQPSAAVRGVVVDSVTRAPVAGAMVNVVGTTRGALTDSTGTYEIRALDPGSYTVRAQRIGYAPATETVSLEAGEVAVVNFAITAVARTLSEVVVVGYGTNTRANISSAIASVEAEDIVNAPVAGVDAALQGKAPGVMVVQNAGNPGAGITVRIRGHSSLSASNQPLFVVDGVPIIRDDLSQLDVGGQDITAVTGINPDEIESIDVLKDAAASAIYGSRGSNGVVIITTKRGLAGDTRLTFNSYAGSQSVYRQWDVLTGPEYIEYMNEAAENDGYGANYFGDPSAATNTDWQDAIFRSAPIYDLNLAASGGTERVRFYLSGSYFDQEGVVIGSGYDRVAGRVNLDFDAGQRLRFRSSLALAREEHERIEGDNTIVGVVTNAIANEPYIPVRRDDGTYTDPGDGLEYANPLAIGEYSSAESRSLRTLGSLEATYTFSPAVSLTGRAGVDVVNLRDIRWFSPRVGGTYAADVNGVAQFGTRTADRYVLESFVTVDRPMGIATALSLTGGGSVEWNGSESDWLVGEDFAHENFRYVGNAGRLTDYASGWTGHNLVSAFGRANGTLYDRYLLTASARIDGSSRFGAENQYGVFPAASFGWILTREPFAAGFADLADFKLRASIGLTGNQAIDEDFAPLSRFGRANYTEEPGIAQTSFGNPELRWESTREIDVGFDLILLGGRLGIIGDWYSKRTTDLLVERPITSTSGRDAVWENVGSMENTGFELGINAIPVEAVDEDGFRWTADFNITWNRNEVTELFQNEPFNSGIRSVNRVEVGYPLGAFQMLRFEGVDPQTGDAIYTDVNGDGAINSADRVVVGSPHPAYWGGLGTDVTWRGLGFRTFLQFSQGAEIYNAIRIFADDGGYYYDNKFADVLRRWQQPGDITDQPRASFDGTSGARQVSSRYLEDGSYIRLQEMTLSYRIPVRLLAQANLREARIYLSGRNLYSFDDYSGYSPDVNSIGSSANISLGTEFYAYPIPRTIMFGIQGSW